MTARDYDVILYGAGGFTGRQTVAYFAMHAPPGLRWAIAGPRRHKLEAARAGAGALLREDDLLVADSGNQAAVDAVVSRARVLVSTAGPFALYGTPVVDACVRFKTHYVDITGETAWVRELITRFHDRAAADGTRVIPFCGFDSVPSDLGALLIARTVQRAHGSPCVEVRGYFQLRGGFNGGTIATLLNVIKTRRKGMSDAFLLNPPSSHSTRQADRSRDVRAPRYDPQRGSWIGPFFMAPMNTRVVRRSAALYAEWQQPYGPDFVYREAMKYDPPLARAKATAATTVLGLFLGLLKRPITRRALTRFLPTPGEGPTVRAMDRGWFTCELLGLTEDGRQVRGVIAYQGDPGNRATTVFLCESALALALDTNALPGGTGRGGVLTPATALGEVLAERLRKAGVRIEIGV